VSLTTGKYSVIDESNPNIFEYVLASSHLPMVFEPMTIDNEVRVDGGIRHQIPIIEALKEDPDEIDVILTSPLGAFNRTSETKNSQLISAPKVAIRTVDILIDQIYESDCYDVTRVMNGDGRMKKIKVRLFAPSVQPSENSMDFSENIIKQGMAMGYEEVKKVLEK
jgi:predicted patatin/cPLA2 family phospholipase